MPPTLSARYLLPAITLSWIVALGVSMPGVSLAQTPPELKRVAFAEDLRVFYDAEEAVVDLSGLQSAMRQGATRQWRSENFSIELISDQDLQEAIVEASLYEGTLALARQWAEMGVDAYKRVQTQDAVTHLERSLQNFETISHEMVDPDEIAEVLLYLALSYLEDGENVMRPLDILQEMIRRDPTRRLERGFYPDFIVQYYQSARDTLWRELRQDGPPIEESRRVAELVDADYVFHGYAVPVEDGAVDLVAYLYNREEDNLFPGETIRIDELTEENLQEGFSRLASRMAAWLVEPDVGPADSSDIASSRGTSRLSLQLGGSYATFLQVPFPLRSSFGNYGFGAGLGWSITREFQLIGNVQVYNSIRDFHGILREDFTTVRGMLGGQLGRHVGPLYLALGTGVEVTSFGPIRAFSDPTCIPAPELCPGDTGTTVFENHGLHWGLQLRPRISLPLADSFELSSSVSVGYYFSPLSDRLLNFPVATELGLQYRF